MSQAWKNKSADLLIELRRSRISGIGVFAVKFIRKSYAIANGLSEDDFDELISWKEFHNFVPAIQRKIGDFCIGTPKGFVPPNALDFNKLTIEWYFNHSCAGNVGFNSKGDFIAIRNIRKGEELTYDYGLAESNPKFEMRCKCGSRHCRGIVTGNDWKEETFRRTRIIYMLPRLRRID